jgi:GcrA cell cycle regulator
MDYFAWPRCAIDELRRLWGKQSAAMIGRKWGISKNAVVGKAHRLDLPRLPSPVRKGAAKKRPPKATQPRRSLKNKIEPPPIALVIPTVSARMCQWVEGERPYPVSLHRACPRRQRLLHGASPFGLASKGTRPMSKNPTSDQRRSDRLALLRYFLNNDADGVAHVKHSRDQGWLLKKGYVAGKIEYPGGRDWPEVRLRLTPAGRAMLNQDATAP